MMLFRSAQRDDLEDIYFLAKQSGTGMTTLPKDKKRLKERLECACISFGKKVEQPSNEYYLFSLENPETQEVVGTSAIEAFVGHDLPFYSYKLSRRSRICHSLAIRSDYDILTLVNDKQGNSELCTLFLQSGFRRSYNGALLSRARFLFMAEFPERFSPNVIAEIRGISNEEGESPFWNNVGKNFFHMSFMDADQLTILTNKQFISDLMPLNPIYVTLLTKEAQEVIGHPHPSTVPAMKILTHEGFYYLNYVDIFDAGPTIEAQLKQIKTIKLSKIATIGTIYKETQGELYLISNRQLDFRATLSPVIFNKEGNVCMISEAAAETLQLGVGDSVRLAPFYIESQQR